MRLGEIERQQNRIFGHYAISLVTETARIDSVVGPSGGAGWKFALIQGIQNDLHVPAYLWNL